MDESKKVDHSRFADIFGDQNDYEDISLESALAASKKPDTKTVKVEAYDTELGWVEEWVSLKSDGDELTEEEEYALYDRDETDDLIDEVARLENERQLNQDDAANS